MEKYNHDLIVVSECYNMISNNAKEILRFHEIVLLYSRTIQKNAKHNLISSPTFGFIQRERQISTTRVHREVKKILFISIRNRLRMTRRQK